MSSPSAELLDDLLRRLVSNAAEALGSALGAALGDWLVGRWRDLLGGGSDAPAEPSQPELAAVRRGSAFAAFSKDKVARWVIHSLATMPADRRADVLDRARMRAAGDREAALTAILDQLYLC